jgi:GNAT superfamily N-acetyltransferase
MSNRLQPAEWRRIEEATFNAWPASRTLLLDGWVLRFANGYTKRANSVNPLHNATLPADQKLALCEQLYASDGQPCRFRLADLGPDTALDGMLETCGYYVLDRSLVLLCDLERPGPWHTTRYGASARQAEWMDSYGRLSNVAPSTREPHSAILSNIAAPAFLAQRCDHDRVVACGLAVCEGALVGLFDIVVDPAERRRGHGRRLLEELLAWAYARGARRAYLQVVEQNQAARALYASLGFKPAYRYWYRVQAPAAQSEDHSGVH